MICSFDGPLTLRLAEYRRPTHDFVLRFDTLDCGPEFQRVLAVRFSELVSGDGTWNSKATVELGFRAVKALLRTVPLDRPSDLQASQWNSFLLSMSPSVRSAYGQSVKAVLRVLPGITESALHAIETGYVGRSPAEVSGIVLSDAQIETLRATCFETLRAAKARVTASWMLVDDFRAGRITPDSDDYLYAQTLDEIARTGDIARRYPSSPSLRVIPPTVLKRLNGSATKRTPYLAYKALYLTAGEGAAAVMGLTITCGWNLSVALNLTTSDISRVDARDGSEPVHLRVTLTKPRRGAVSTWSETYFDNGARSKARMIMMLLEATEGARRTLASVGHPTDAVLVVLSGGLNSGRQTPSGIPLFTLADVHLRTVLAHLAGWRKDHPELDFATARALRHYFVTQVHPQGHTAATNTEYALQDPRVRQDAQEAIAAGLEAALDDVQARVTSRDFATAAEAPIAANLGVLDALNAGHRDTVAAACQDPTSNPATGSPCEASFLTCFACKNAVILRRHLPRVVALIDHFELLRATTDEHTWSTRYQAHYARIRSLTSPGPYFSPDDLKRARDTVTAGDRNAVERLMRREWDTR